MTSIMESINSNCSISVVIVVILKPHIPNLLANNILAIKRLSLLVIQATALQLRTTTIVMSLVRRRMKGCLVKINIKTIKHPKMSKKMKTQT